MSMKANFILKSLTEPIMPLRKITREDWDYILNLRNRNFKYFEKQTKPIEKDEHYSYMEKQESNPNFHAYLYSGVVYVRVLDNDIGIITDRPYRRCGLATKALKEVYKLHNNLFATISVTNTASFKLFLKASLAFN